MLPLVGFLLALGISLVSPSPVEHPDRVTSLPGAPTADLPFPLYSGFLQVADSGVQQHEIFYVLCEAIRTNPSEAPLVVWLNGGPGASSLIGFLLEHGPYLIDPETGSLEYNDFSWNQYANVLYIESPSDVGFSHSNVPHVSYDDFSTAILNRKAIQDFMARVHPRYATRDFYISGESYAGVYIPYLTREILNRTATGEFHNQNFKGIAMGNAGVDSFSNYVSAALQQYSLGMIPENRGEEVFEQWRQTLKGARLGREGEKYLNDNIGEQAIYNIPLECNRNEDQQLYHIAKPTLNVECIVENLTETYFNRPDVQRSLHVRTQTFVHWTAISYEVIGRYLQDGDTIPIYKDIIALAGTNFRILFYTGDMDMVCPPIQVAFGARRIAQENNMTDISPFSHWRYLGDFGGVRSSYGTSNGHVSMDVITVRGAGHMVPINRPDRAFQIINNFITAEAGIPIDYSKMIPRR